MYWCRRAMAVAGGVVGGLSGTCGWRPAADRIFLQYLPAACAGACDCLYQLEIDHALYESQLPAFQQWVVEMQAARG